MTSSRTLQAEDRVAHYRVVGPLGAGGMGEVYLAQDENLERNVAIKVLPPELVRSEDRVRRFVQEAKSASSLNHPNIITIYEIGEETVTSASGEVSPDPVRYISMELVSGRTLSTKIHEENTDLRTLLGYLAQAAEGIAKAHAAGIVHRDIKPGNIMVSDDGFAKVLDFGLAKLTEKRGPEADATATAFMQSADQTAEGTIMGTAHYMSPEQIQGKIVDHRSDIFSFGCILYEAATRRRPFSGDSYVETMHQILHDSPTPIEDVDAAVPNELRRLIRRCLKKSPDRRLQSMKDLALELHEIVDEFHELSMSGTITGSGIGALPATPARRPWLAGVFVVGIAVIAAAAYFGLRGGTRPSESGPTANPVARMSTATRTGNVLSAAMSRDGRYLAYTNLEAGEVVTYVRQIATGADVEVIPPTDRTVDNLQFSPDGNYLYYTARTPDARRYRTLYRIPSLGGQPEKRGFDVDSPVEFSPDGTRMAFVRLLPGRQGTIQIAPTGGGDARELIRFPEDEELETRLSWSPDGSVVAALVFSAPPAATTTIVTIDVENGTRKDVLRRKSARMQGVAFNGDGSALVVSAAIAEFGLVPQVYRVSYPGAEIRRITNDLNTYFDPQVSEDGVVAVTRWTALPDLWIVDLAGNQELMVRGTSADTAPTNASGGRDAFVYVQPWDRGSRLYVQSPDGTPPRLIPTGDALITFARCGGETVFFQQFDPESGQMTLWTVNLDGSGLRQVTRESGWIMDISEDGRTLAYMLENDTSTLWLLDSGWENPHRLPEAIHGRSTPARLSPDGSRILVGLDDGSGDLVRTVFKIFPVDGDGPPQTLDIPGNNLVSSWIAGEDAIAYTDAADPVRNLWRLPLDGSEPTQLTAFTAGQRVGTKFAPDGRQFVATLRSEDGDNLWLFERGSLEPKKLTSFSGQFMFWVDWLGNSRQILVGSGVRTSDVVLIRDFE